MGTLADYKSFWSDMLELLQNSSDIIYKQIKADSSVKLLVFNLEWGTVSFNYVNKPVKTKLPDSYLQILKYKTFGCSKAPGSIIVTPNIIPSSIGYYNNVPFTCDVLVKDDCIIVRSSLTKSTTGLNKYVWKSVFEDYNIREELKILSTFGKYLTLEDVDGVAILTDTSLPKKMRLEDCDPVVYNNFKSILEKIGEPIHMLHLNFCTLTEGRVFRNKSLSNPNEYDYVIGCNYYIRRVTK